ncbi:hypothetical protein ACJX0J_020618 [Zea mays]
MHSIFTHREQKKEYAQEIKQEDADSNDRSNRTTSNLAFIYFDSPREFVCFWGATMDKIASYPYFYVKDLAPFVTIGQISSFFFFLFFAITVQLLISALPYPERGKQFFFIHLPGPNGNTVGFTTFKLIWIYNPKMDPEIDELPLNQFNQEKTLQESVKLFVLYRHGLMLIGLYFYSVNGVLKKSQYDNLNYLMQKRWFLARDAHLILINGTRELDSKKGLDQRSMMTTERGKGQPLDRTPKTAPAGVDKKPLKIPRLH